MGRKTAWRAIFSRTRMNSTWATTRSTCWTNSWRRFDSKVTEEMYDAVDALNANLAEKMAANGFTDSEIAAAKLDMHDVIIVASLIEKETAKASESPSIAAVIYNRLCSKLYPCLEIDATIQYALDERKEVLSNADKGIISPYNTYKNAACPQGRSRIRASRPSARLSIPRRVMIISMRWATMVSIISRGRITSIRTSSRA